MGCEEEEIEELYSGQLGIIPSSEGHLRNSMVVAIDPCRGERAVLQIG
jgi:hypothetical protein